MVPPANFDRLESMASRFRYFFKISVLAVIYIVLGKFSLELGAVNKFAAPIWPPTGFSLAALFIFGLDLWPGVAIGAFIVNWWLGANVLVSLGIAGGNTLEAITGAWLLFRFSALRNLGTLNSVLTLVFPVAIISTLLSATIGVFSLFLDGKIPPASVATTWSAWWVGDMMGNLVIAPLLLVWSTKINLKQFRPRQWIEVFLISISFTFLALIIFSNWFLPGTQLFPRPFCVFPMLGIIAIRLGQRGVVTANFILSTILLYFTANEIGNFWKGDLSESLQLAQVFLAVVSSTSLVLAAATDERKRLYSEAQKAITIRDEFLSVASHELRTPLTILSLRLQLLDREIKTALPTGSESSTKISEILHASQEQSRRLKLWLTDLLDLDRIHSDKLRLIMEKMDLVTVVNEAVEYFKISSGKNKELLSVVSPELVVGTWDRMRIERVVNNLISNAIKYGNGKPITVTVEQDEFYHCARLIVSDQGIGILPNKLNKIFERYERAVDPHSSIGGLGLGLYICRQIVEEHRGTITVASEIGRGSTFTVELPIKTLSSEVI